MEAPYGFDLILAEQTMPGITANKLALKISAKRPDIPVRRFAGFCHLADEERAKAIGIRKLIMKPVGTGDLAVIVRWALDQIEDAQNHGKNTDC